jgi:diguanylate cyclase (GGDEF)-like protein
MYAALGAVTGSALVVALWVAHADATLSLLAGATLLGVIGFLIGRNTDRLAQNTLHDAWTGLPNRRFFAQRLAEELDRTSRHRSSLALLVINVDRLKHINQWIGRSGGDTTLRLIAERIRRNCRITDLPARIGGDAFAVLAPCTNAAQARVLAERVRIAVHSRVCVHQQYLQESSVSIGVASVEPPRWCDAETFLREAELALLAAKNKGGDCVQIGVGSAAATDFAAADSKAVESLIWTLWPRPATSPSAVGVLLVGKH